MLLAHFGYYQVKMLRYLVKWMYIVLIFSYCFLVFANWEKVLFMATRYLNIVEREKWDGRLLSSFSAYIFSDRCNYLTTLGMRTCPDDWLSFLIMHTFNFCSRDVNGVGVGHGRVSRFLVCHIPFHSKSGFWQERRCPARWLIGSFGSISVVGPSHAYMPLCYTAVYLIHTNIYSWLKRRTVPLLQTPGKTIVCVCEWVMLEEWFTDSVQPGMIQCTLQGYARSHYFIFGGRLASGGTEHVCLSAGPTNDGSAVFTRNIIIIIGDRRIQDFQ